MKTVSSLTLLFYALLLCTSSFAQKKTVPGYYISMQGDTVKGVFSNYSQWNRNPSAIEFATATSANKIKLTPQGCQKIVIEGYDEYLAYSGPRMVNPIYDDQAIKSRGDSSSIDMLEDVETFLRLVTRVPGCELYVYNDSKRINFFYRLTGQSIIELKYKKYCIVSDVTDMVNVYEVKNIITTTAYRDQLNSVFGESIEKQQRSPALNKLPYTEHALKNFLEELFVVDRVKYRHKNPTAGWIVSAGVSRNFVNVKADKSFNIVAKEYKSSISPLLSIGYLAPVGWSFNKYFLYPQLDFFRQKNTGELNDGNFRKVTTFQAGLVIAAQLNAGVNVVNQSNIRFYLSGGVGMLTLHNNIRLDEKYLYTRPTELYGSSQRDIALSATPYINASAGVVLKNRFLLSAAYLFPTQIENTFNYNPQFSGVQLKIGYKVK